MGGDDTELSGLATLEELREPFRDATEPRLVVAVGEAPPILPVPLSGESAETGLDAIEDMLSFRFIIFIISGKFLSRCATNSSASSIVRTGFTSDGNLLIATERA